MRGYENRLYNLVGTTITITVPILTGTGYYKRKVQYLVTEAHPYYISCERRCENGVVIKECFDIGTLITQGIVDQRGDRICQ